VGLRIQDLGFRVQGFNVRSKGLGYRGEGSEGGGGTPTPPSSRTAQKTSLFHDRLIRDCIPRVRG